MNQNERLLKFLQASPEAQEAIDRILDGKAPTMAKAATGPLLCGMSAAAEYLGVSRATLWRMIKAGRLERVEVLANSYQIGRAHV